MSAFWCTLKVLDEINRMRAAIGNTKLVPESVDGGVYFIRIPEEKELREMTLDADGTFLGVPICKCDDA